MAVVARKVHTGRENPKDKGQGRDKLRDITYEVKNNLLCGDQFRASACPSFRSPLHICPSISN